MLKPLTDDCFIAVMQFVESGNPSNVFKLISENGPEDCARIYVASLMLQGRDFPPVVNVSEYLTVLNDKGVFYELYKAASCGGISASDIKSLYESSELPEMIWTKVDDILQRNIPEKSKETIDRLLDAVDIKPVYTLLKPGMCPLSDAAKALRNKGAIVKSYKVIVNRKSVILNVIEYHGSVSCDINTLHCKDIDTFVKEFKHKFLNK
jgi:hypothetical protein